jgi:hypothetical protein
MLSEPGTTQAGTMACPSLATAAAAQELGEVKKNLHYYRLVPEWITGMGIVMGETT